MPKSPASFVGLAGLPRTGSTLLSALLSQNPDIHAEGNSAVCQLMWDLQQSCEVNSAEQLKANYRHEDQDVFVKAIPSLYYRNITAKYIVDKCRSWTLPSNMQMLRRYITDDPKVIVLTRPLEEVIESFIKLRTANGWENPQEGLWDKGSEPVMRSLEGVQYAKTINKGEFLFIDYKSFVTNPKQTIEEIYAFCHWPLFEHDFGNVVNRHPENDDVYGLKGMHDIRPCIQPPLS